MFGSIGRSWNLYKVCWRVLLHDKELLLFPLISGISLAITLAVIFGSGLVTRVADSVDDQFQMVPADYVVLGVFYFVNYFLIIYFNAAIIGAARIRLRGGDPTLRDGFRAANQNLWGIVGWAAISAVVSLIFYALDKFARRQLHERGGGMAIIMIMIVSSIARMGWSFITYLVIPVLVTEKVGPIRAIKRSASLLRATWGEQVISRFGFDLMVMVLGIPIVLVALAIGVVVPAPIGVIVAIAFAVVGIGLLILVTAALRAIYIAVLYEYATSGTIPELFPSELVKDSWGPRGSTGGGRSGGLFDDNPEERREWAESEKRRLTRR